MKADLIANVPMKRVAILWTLFLVFFLLVCSAITLVTVFNGKSEDETEQNTSCPETGRWPCMKARKITSLDCVGGGIIERQCLMNNTWSEMDWSHCIYQRTTVIERLSTLKWMSTMCIAISLLALFGSLYWLLHFRFLPTLQTFIFFNLCLNLILEQIIFCLMSNFSDYLPTKFFVTVFHFCYLATYGWIASLVMNLLAIFISPQHHSYKKSFMVFYCILSYGFSAITVIGYLLGKWQLFGKSPHMSCWTSGHGLTHHLSYSPVVLLLTVSVGILIYLRLSTWDLSKETIDARKSIANFLLILFVKFALHLFFGLTVNSDVFNGPVYWAVRFIFSLLHLGKGFLVFAAMVHISRQVERETLETSCSVQENFAWLKQNKFFITTPVSGFSFISSSRKWFEVGIWYLIIIFFFGLTAKNIIELVKHYNLGQTVTRIRLGNVKDLVFIPPLSFELYAKLPLIASDVKPFSDKNNSLSPLIKPIKEQIDEAFTKLDTKEKFLDDQWPYSMLLAISYYFSKLMSTEFGSVHTIKPLNWSSTSNVDFNMAFTAHNHSVQLGVTDHQLWRKFTAQLTKTLGLEAGSTWECDGKFQFTLTFGDEIAGKDTEMSFLDASSEFTSDKYYLNVWWPPTPRAANCTSWYYWFQDRINYRDDALKRNYDFDFENLTECFPEVFNSMNDKILARHIGNRQLRAISALEAHFGEMTMGDVHATSQFELFNKSSRTCDPGSISKRFCDLDCFSAVIERRCHCIPMFMNVDRRQPSESFQSQIPTCTLEQYLNCMTGYSEEMRNCKLVCPFPCNYANYEFISIPDRSAKFTDPAQKKWAYIRLENLYKVDYPLFSEAPAVTWEQFLAELGGTIDFYLSISVIAVLHVFVYLAKQLIYIFSDKTKTGKRIRKWTAVPREQKQLLELLTFPAQPSFLEQQEENIERVVAKVDALAQRMDRLENVIEKIAETLDVDISDQD